jgi:DNA polymerase III epsilon subunit-like protein
MAAIDDYPAPEAESGPGVEVYFSVDLETDGPIPGEYSLLSIGACMIGSYDGTTFIRAHPVPTFYIELRPVQHRFQPEAMAVNQLDRERLRRDGRDPRGAMEEFADWVRSQAKGRRPVAVSYPASFDWTWLHWYFVRYLDHNPFGFSGSYDIKTMFAAKSGHLLTDSVKRLLPLELRSSLPHTHHALDDALEQAEIFVNLFNWHPPDPASAPS